LAWGELEAGLVTFDTSALVAISNRRDANHARTTAALDADRGPYIVPVAILAEAAYFIERELGQGVLVAFIDDLIDGRFVLDCGESDLSRARNLVSRYGDLPLGLADAMVIACAERHGGKVMTLDLRHFGVVARDGTIAIVP
jgi:predicted nucleic acid-binding protein